MDGVKIYSTVGSVNASLQRSQEDRRHAGPLCAANAKRRRRFQRAGILRPRVKAASRLACPLTAEASAQAGRTPNARARSQASDLCPCCPLLAPCSALIREIRTIICGNFVGLRKFFKLENRNPKHETNAKFKFLNPPNLRGRWFRVSSFSHSDLFRILIFGFRIWLRLCRTGSSAVNSSAPYLR